MCKKLGYPFDGSRNPNTVIEVVKQARKFMPPTAPVSCPICGLLMKCSSYSGDKIVFTFICPNDHAWGMTLLGKKED